MVAAAAAGPRYAPPDPTLPSPWKGLIDGATGYIYYWNPETNVTQYERPAAAAAPNAALAGNDSSADVHGGGSGNGHASSAYGMPKLASIPSQGGGYGAANGSYDRGGDYGSEYRKPHRTASTISAAEADEYRKKHEIVVMGDAPPPITTFEAGNFPPEVLRELTAAGFPGPTPIQAQSWPIGLEGKDCVAVAKTGSGKTLGYLLPAFVHLQARRMNSRLGPGVLVLAPTRELATQIQEEAVKFGRSSRIASTCVYGGAPKGPQLRDIERGADIVIATPGRLNDFLEARKISLRQIFYLVLDEADRMLDMGFEPQIRKIVAQMPQARQTLMYTATWPKEVRRIADDLLRSPAQVRIGNTDELVANKAITQLVEVIAGYDKQRRVEEILRSFNRGDRVIIFCSTKRMCDQLSRTLNYSFGAAAIHGDKSQPERDHVLAQFRNGSCPVLVATDVAARGLDVKDIKAVVNYDFPTGVEDYVHRIGRTGRAGASGIAYTLFTQQDGKYARELIKVLEGAGQNVPPELRGMAASGGFGRPTSRWGSGGGGGGYGGGGGGGGGGFGGSFGFGNGAGAAFGGRGAMDFGRTATDSYGGRAGGSDAFGGRGAGNDPPPAKYPDYAAERGRDAYDRSYDKEKDKDSRSRAKSRSRSRSPVRRKSTYSRSRSKSPAKSRSYRSRSRSPVRRY